MVPFVLAVLAVVATADRVDTMVLEIIAINALWVVASFGLLFSGIISRRTCSVSPSSAFRRSPWLCCELRIGLRRQAG